MKLLLYLKFLIYRGWEHLSSDDQQDFLRSYSSQICFDCGETGEPGFCQFYGHDCLGKGYVPGEAAGFIKFCTTCGQYYDSITELIFHNVTIHKRLPKVGCVLHIVRLHGGWFNFNLMLKKMYGPCPSCF